jgi:protease II
LDFGDIECRFSLPGHYAEETYPCCVHTQEKVEGDAEMLLDPITWSEDGTGALAIMKFSEDAEYLAYGQSASGSDWITIKVIHVADRVIQPDTLSWVRLLFPCASTVLLTFEFVYFGLLNLLAFLSLAHSTFILFYL